MRKNYLDVAVVMITRNEEKAISKVIRDAKESLPGCTVFVIDGSSDNTPTLAREAGAIVIREPGGGFGPALHCALMTPGTEFKYIATVDADDTYPAENFPRMVDLLDLNYDLVGTNRLTLTPTRNMPFLNWMANTAFNVIASLRCGTTVRDVHSGQRIYRRELLHEFDWDFEGYAFPIDLIFWPAMTGKKFKEINIKYRKRIGETTLVRGPSGRASVKRLFRSKHSIMHK